MADVRGAQGEVIIGNRRVLAGVDIITHLDDREIADWNELIEYLELNKRAGETVAVTLLRDGQPLELLIVLGTEP